MANREEYDREIQPMATHGVKQSHVLHGQVQISRAVPPPTRSSFRFQLFDSNAGSQTNFRHNFITPIKGARLGAYCFFTLPDFGPVPFFFWFYINWLSIRSGLGRFASAGTPVNCCYFFGRNDANQLMRRGGGGVAAWRTCAHVHERAV